MIEKRLINEHLSKALCYRCGESLEGGQLTPISEVELAVIAHVVCPKCKAESMVTITHSGSGTVPITSDLTGSEFKKFMGAKKVTIEEVLELHKKLQKEPLWKLLQKKEKFSEKKQNN